MIKVMVTSVAMLTPQLSYPWKLFPLYGLQIDDDDGLAHPLFRDATLISHKSAMTLVAQISSQAHADVLSRPMTPELHDGKTLPPIEYLVEVPPDSMIAVRCEKDDDALMRAKEIRAFLSATLMLRGGTLTAFASHPSALTWSVDHSSLYVGKDGLHRATRTVGLNPNVVRNRLTVTKQALRTSWKCGEGLLTSAQPWDIHSIHPVSEILAGRKSGKQWLAELRIIGVRINDACCANLPQHRLQMAVSTIESLMRTQKFEVVQDRARTWGLATLNGPSFEEVLDARHQFVHKGRLPKDPEKYATAGLVSAWILYDFACAFAMRYPSGDEWDAFLNHRVHNAKLFKIVEGFAQDRAKDIRTSLESALKPLFESPLTLNISVPQRTPTGQA